MGRQGIPGHAPDEYPRGGRVIPGRFELVRPASVEEAVAALAAYGDDAKVLAGGHSLLPLMKLRLAMLTC